MRDRPFVMLLLLLSLLFFLSQIVLSKHAWTSPSSFLDALVRCICLLLFPSESMMEKDVSNVRRGRLASSLNFVVELFSTSQIQVCSLVFSYDQIHLAELYYIFSISIFSTALPMSGDKQKKNKVSACMTKHSSHLGGGRVRKHCPGFIPILSKNLE